jgi:sodium-dependent dicarboxylate transporter 2/3/5
MNCLLGSSSPKMLLDWKSIEEKMPWELVFLLGGGFALAKGTSVSGLSTFLGDQVFSQLRF